MNRNSLFIMALLGVSLFVGGCDLSWDQSNTGGGTNPFGPQEPVQPQDLTACVLLNYERVGSGSAEDPLCPGTIIQLNGFNFSDNIDEHRVLFSAGGGAILGMPLSVVNRRVDLDSETVESSLEVIVPTGVTSGNIELLCHGVSAGAVGFDACPAIYAVTLGANEDEEYVVYTPLLSRFQENSRVNLYGINLSDVLYIDIDDGSGNSVRVTSSTFINNNSGGFVPGEAPSGYESFSFVLNDGNNGNNNVSFPFALPRENLGIVARSTAGISNRVEIPVANENLIEVIGAVVNGMRVPSGVSTGPVRVDYTCYELVVDASYTMEFEWAVDVGQPDLEWNPAKPRDEDPDNEGKFEITCGTIQHKYPGRRLLPSGGLRRTFVWDAQCDPLFRELNETIEGGVTPPRYWKVHFRVRPIPDAGEREFSEHAFEAPSFIYYWVEDRPEDEVVGWRSGEVVESFDTDFGRNLNLSDASWGAPYNPGLLEGETNTNDIYQFGQGEAEVYLEIQPVDNFIDPDTITGQYYLIDTDRVDVSHVLLRNVALEGEPAVIAEESRPYILTDDGTPDGNRVINPGEAVDEFHFATFTIAPQTTVFVQGDRPLVMRVSGGGNAASDTDPVFTIMGALDLNGGDGADGSLVGGQGGDGTAGGGAGGDGALMQLNTGATVRLLEPAMAGANGGGAGGTTPAAINPDQARNSTFAGAPGGGGGHREAGGDGNYGNPNIPNFSAPRVGAGGVIRGNALLTPLTTGSGGGGGGASLSRTTGGEFAATGGGGGGGGGGALRLTARGGVVVIGSVQANGGGGGSGRVPPGEAPAGTTNGGAGGGGSGGSIHLRATGSVDVSTCDSLQVRGGAGGTGGPSNGQNRTGGRGIGSDGYIRLESGTGGTPFCMTLQASTRLTSTLSGSNNRNQTIRVQSTQAFPNAGKVKIDDEVIAYSGKTANTFTGLTRAIEGSRVSHSSGTSVFISPSTIQPADDPTVLMNGGFIEAPEEPEFGRGRDGVVHLRFIQSLDPDTGAPLSDTQTGRPLSVWVFDTASSTLRSPVGNIVKETRASDNNPGFMDLSALIIDEDVVLRATGPNPLRISVRDYAEISGTIDASGGHGGALRFTQGGGLPAFGFGGVPGAGGGAGGDGGMVTNFDVNPNNIQVSDAGDSLLPNIIETANTFGIQNPPITGSTGGSSLGGRTCGIDCFESGGGGGGGGNLRAGSNGDVLLLPGRGGLRNSLVGQGGDLVNFRDQRLYLNNVIIGLALVGGLGGGGGGASANVSRTYQNGSISGTYPYKGEALYAPGTGGGGGGGIINIVANDLYLRSTSKLLARGGDAYQSIDLAGNGGAGAGGTIFLQVKNTITIENGFQSDVSAGEANRLPPFFSSGIRLYEGNIRASQASPPALTGTAFGGLGGGAANGRIRIEFSPTSRIRSQGVNPSVTTGPFLWDIVESVAVSRIHRLGVGPGFSASTHGLMLDGARVVYNTFQQPPGTRAVVVWESAGESLDVHGQADELNGLVRDPRNLKGTRFVRFRVYFQSKFGTGESQSLQSLSLPFRLDEAGCLPFGF